MVLSRRAFMALGFILLLLAVALLGALARVAFKRAPPAAWTGAAEDAYEDEFGPENELDFLYGAPDEGYDGAYAGGGRPFRLFTRGNWYKLALDGKKTVWARLRTGPFADDARMKLGVGDTVVVARSRPKDEDPSVNVVPHKYETKIVKITKYKGFKELLKGEGLDKVFPGAKTAAAALETLGEFYKKVDLESFGAVAIELAPYKA